MTGLPVVLYFHTKTFNKECICLFNSQYVLYTKGPGSPLYVSHPSLPFALMSFILFYSMSSFFDVLYRFT